MPAAVAISISFDLAPLDVATIQPFEFIDETLADYAVERAFFDPKGIQPDAGQRLGTFYRE